MLLICLIPPDPARADCFQDGDQVLCTGIDFNGFISDQSNLIIEIGPDALVRNIDTVQRRGNCPLSFPAVSIGSNSTVTNMGRVLTFGVCGSGVQTGGSSTVINQGSITTNDILAFGVDTGANSNVTNTGEIQTRELAGHGIFVDDNSIVANETSGLIETSGIVATGITGRNNVTITNGGAIRTSGQGSHGIDLLENGSVLNTGTISVTGFQSVGIRLKKGANSVANTGVIQTTFAGPTDPNNPEDGIQSTGSFTSINNAGIISVNAPGGAAIRITSEGSGDIVVSNSGMVTAPAGGVIATIQNNRFTLFNTGIISATGPDSTAIRLISGIDAQSFLNNSGTISTLDGQLAIVGSSGRDEIINTGLIVGDIALGSGNDLLTLQSGSVLSGDSAIIDGGEGNDDLILTGSGNFGSDIINFEELTRFGNGIWRLERDTTFDTRARIFDGELEIASGALFIVPVILNFEEGLFSLNGTAVGAVTNDGVLSVNRNAVIDGSLLLGETGTLQIQPPESGATNSPVLMVTGEVQLNGTLRMGTITGSPINNGATLTILSGQSVSGDFDAIDLGSGAFLAGSTSITSTGVAVTFTRTPYASAARSANAGALAQALDGALSTAPEQAHNIFHSLDALNLDSAGQALNTLVTSLPLALASLDILAVRESLTALTRNRASKSGAWGDASRVFGAFNGETDGVLHRRTTRLTAGIDISFGDTSTLGLVLSQSTYRARSTDTGAALDGNATLAGASLRSELGPMVGHVALLAGDLQSISTRRGGFTGLASVDGKNDGQAWPLTVN